MPDTRNDIIIAYFGEHGVDFDEHVYRQMETAVSIPVARRAAVMPDAHSGYALPIGGVIALDNAVSPSFVGYDIACRVTMTIVEISPHEFIKERDRLARDMKAVSSFGLGSGFKGKARRQHEIMEHENWNRIKILKTYQKLAAEQLGSSGGGNHFFDALIGEVLAPADWLPLPVGTSFIAMLTHSGSRGVGNRLAHRYVEIARQETHKKYQGIPSGYEWLDLDSRAGHEYWEVMQLMGQYACANHQLIHDSFFKRSGLSQIIRYENHHNFASKEGNLIVHRKGAIAAGQGQIAVIPGTSGTASYLVEGLGNEKSLNSSSHGAGRPRSRSASKKIFDEKAFQRYMKANDILSYGVEPDETFMAYKDIERIMMLQENVLVRTVARMFPLIVIMGGKADDGD